MVSTVQSILLNSLSSRLRSRVLLDDHLVSLDVHLVSSNAYLVDLMSNWSHLILTFPLDVYCPLGPICHT